jgi:hypothetical protein
MPSRWQDSAQSASGSFVEAERAHRRLEIDAVFISSFE